VVTSRKRLKPMSFGWLRRGSSDLRILGGLQPHYFAEWNILQHYSATIEYFKQ